MDRFRFTLRTASALVLAAIPAAGQPVDLELACRPEHGLRDRRQERPADVRQHSPFSTYYLFDNPRLFEYRVGLTNVGPVRRVVGDEDVDWARSLRIEVERDGVRLGRSDIRIEPARRMLRRLVYLRGGQPIAAPQFRRQLAAPGAEPISPYDDYREEEETVEALPTELGTYEEAVAVLRLTAANGGDLPLGLYLVSVADERNRAACLGRQLVVLRAPSSALDTVDAHIVRARAYQAQGDLEAAAGEMARATELAPDNLKGWVYRSAVALARNDLAGQAEAATKLESLLAQQAGPDQDEFVGVTRDAEAVARHAPELRRLLAAEHGSVP